MMKLVKAAQKKHMQVVGVRLITCNFALNNFSEHFTKDAVALLYLTLFGRNQKKTFAYQSD